MATWTNVVNVTGVATVAKTVSKSASAVISLSETIAGSGTTQVFQAIDVSAVAGIVINSTVAVTLKTNSSGSPDNTIVLVADQPYIWYTAAYDTFKLTTDVVSIYCVVAVATAGTLTIEGVVDATP